jgi:hypothetical protein
MKRVMEPGPVEIMIGPDSAQASSVRLVVSAWPGYAGTA